jgi:hypothetical protein
MKTALQPTKLKNAKLPEAETISGVKCAGCEKVKRFVTHNNVHKQGFCQRCNMRLIRKFGAGYGEVLANPAAALKDLEEKKEATKDRKAVRKIFFGLIGMMEDCELEDHQRKQVFGAFSTVLAGLPEADPFVNKDDEGSES